MLVCNLHVVKHLLNDYPVEVLSEDAREGEGDDGAHVAAAEGHRRQPAPLQGRRPPVNQYM